MSMAGGMDREAGQGHGFMGRGIGDAVSAAAHQAQAEARAAGAQVGPAVSAAVHEAQQAARHREAQAEDREVGMMGTTPTPR